MNSNKIIITLLLTFSLLSVFASTPTDSIGRKTLDGKEFILYMVSGGETIYGISTKYNVTIDELMEYNPELVNGLKTAMILNVPYYPEQIKEFESSRKKHVVQPGETLYGLAKKFNVPLNDLLKWNGMELKAGQTLFLSSNDTPDKKAKESKPDFSEIVVPNDDKSEDIEEEIDEEVEEIVIESEKKEVKSLDEILAEEKAKTEKIKEEEAKEENSSTNSSNSGNENYASTNPYWTDEIKPAPELGPKLKKRVMIIPFDPYLYFSDADAEIANASNIQQTKVRQVFRRRLNAMLEPKGYETIHLLGGVFRDSIGDLNKIYKSVNYNYQEILDNGGNHTDEQFLPPTDKKKKSKIDLSDKFNFAKSTNPAKDQKSQQDNRYFGVQIKDPRFYEYFGQKYGIDYYVFINQFEVRTDYQTCLDRSSNNYQRNFLTHFSIFDSKGNQIAGNKITTYYHSNSSNVQKIVLDNMPQVAEQIMQQIPPPGY